MDSPPPPKDAGPIEYDPVFLNSRREAIIIFCVWVAALFWSVPYCYFNGYPDKFDPEQISTVWGIPTWLFWGIAFPWLLADVFTTWFCFFYMVDDDLGEAAEGADIEEEIAELHAARDAQTGEKEADQ